MKNFLDLADFSREEVLDLLALARRLETHPEPRALAGKILGLVFFNPSLRTLASFQVGMQRLRVSWRLDASSCVRCCN